MLTKTVRLDVGTASLLEELVERLGMNTSQTIREAIKLMGKKEKIDTHPLNKYIGNISKKRGDEILLEVNNIRKESGR